MTFYPNQSLYTCFCWLTDCFGTPWLIRAVGTLGCPITFQLERNGISFRTKVGFLLNHAVLFIRSIGTMVNTVTFQGTWNGVPLRTSVSGIIDPCNIKQEISAYCEANQKNVDGRNSTEVDRPECKCYENFDTVSYQFWNSKNCIFKFNSLFIKSNNQHWKLWLLLLLC